MRSSAATWRVAQRSARGRVGRILATLLGAAISAAFAAAGFGVAASFQTLVTGVTDSGDLSVGLPDGSVIISAATGGTTEPTSITTDLVDRVREVRGVLSAQGTYEQPIGVEVPDGSQDDRPPILKNLIFSSAFDAARWRMIEGRAPEPSPPEFRFVEVALDEGAMRAAFATVGSQIRLETPIGRVDAVVVGRAAPVGASPTADSATPGIDDVRLVAAGDDLPWMLGVEGRVDRINVIPDPGVGADELLSSLRTSLPDGLAFASASDRAANQSRVVNTITDGITAGTWAFAGVSALVAAVLVANTFSILVAQRVRAIGLARTIGMSRRQVMATVLIEAVGLGALAAAIGLAASVPLAHWGASLINPDSENPVRLTWQMGAAALGVGGGMTILAAVIPALRASRVSPLDGIRSAVSSRRRKNIGWLLSAPILAGLTPLLAPFRTTRLALASARRDARRSGATASTLSIAFGLVAVVLTASATVRNSVGDQFIGSTSADVYLQRRGLVRVDAPSLERRLGVRGDVGFTSVSSVEGRLQGPEGRLTDVSATRAESIEGVFDLDVTEGALLGEDETGVMLSTQGAETLGVRVGDDVDLIATAGQSSTLRVTALYSNAAFYGSAIVDWTAAEELNALGTFELGALDVPSRLSTRRAIRFIGRELDGFHKVRVERPEAFVELNTSVTDTVTRLILVLLSGSVMLGGLGLSNTISLSVVERRRELALLRSVGALPHQIRALITTEAVILSAVGASLGVAVGTAMAVIGLGRVPAQFAAVVVIPWSRLGLLLVAATAVGALSAWVPALAASRRPILGDLAEPD